MWKDPKKGVSFTSFADLQSTPLRRNRLMLPLHSKVASPPYPLRLDAMFPLLL